MEEKKTLKLVERVGFLLNLALEEFDGFPGFLLEDAYKQVFFVFEVNVNGTLCNPGNFGYVLDPCSVVAFPAEYRNGCLCNIFSFFR